MAQQIAELEIAERIVHDLERAGVLVILVDSAKLTFDGPTSNASGDLLLSARDNQRAIVQLIQATFAHRWSEENPGDTATGGVARLSEIAVCLSIDLDEEDLVARLKTSIAFQTLQRTPAVIQYPVADLQKRLIALEAWSPHLPELG
jgi:hypothetical protein